MNEAHNPAHFSLTGFGPDASPFPWEKAYPCATPWRSTFPGRPVHAIMDEAAARFPERPCVSFLGRRYTYAAMANRINRFAAGLQRLGIGKGDRVGILLPNCPFSVMAYYGILKAGATVVNFNPLYAEHELRHQAEDSGIALMVTLDLQAIYGKLEPLLTQGALRRVVVCRLADALPFPKNWLFPFVKRKELAAIAYDARILRLRDVLAQGDRPQPVSLDPDQDVAVLQYTGGTTGVPKGAMLTHANISANAAQALNWLPDPRPGYEVMLCVLPFFHVFAMTVELNLGVSLGAELVLLPRFDLDQVMATIHQARPTLFPAVPTIYTAINTHPRLGEYDLTSIRYCISGGAPLPVEVKKTFEANTGCALVEGYGLTETAPVVCCNPLHGVNKAGSIGVPVPGTVVEIISLEDRNRVLGIGERGELCVRGPQVMRGYWNKKEETAEVIDENGRLHTGDVAIVDEDGYVFIVDRIKDMILCSGYNVYPRNIEEAIYQHPAVAECVVAGLPDPYRGQTVKAYVRLLEGETLTLENLNFFLKDKLSPIEMPKILEIREELPKTMIGKLSRKALLDEEAGREQTG